MSLPEPVPAAAFRICIVQAVRGGEALVLRLIQRSEHMLAQACALESDQAQVDSLSGASLQAQALRALELHRDRLLKDYPLILLESFAEPEQLPEAEALQAALYGATALHDGLASGAQVLGAGLGSGHMAGVGALALVDDDAALQLQRERRQFVQAITAQLGAVLPQLDALVSAAQGLVRVQASRNPLRPENYVQALQKAIAQTQVGDALGQCWMDCMRTHFGGLLMAEYARAIKLLREQGVQPLPLETSEPPAEPEPVSGFSSPGAYGRRRSDMAPAGSAQAQAQSRAYAEHLEEDRLTLQLVREMLADAQWVAQDGAASEQGLGHDQTGLDASQMLPLLEEAIDAQAALQVLQALSQPASLSAPLSQLPQLPQGWSSISGMALESVQHHSSQVAQLMQVLRGSTGDALAARTLRRMMRHIAEDARLLPSVQRAVRYLEPVLQQLVQQDSRFFEDRLHPARLLLDELTARSLWFVSESAPGFAVFMQATNSAIVQLSAVTEPDAQAFAQVTQGLRETWAASGAPQGQERGGVPEQSLETSLWDKAVVKARDPRAGHSASAPLIASADATQIAQAIRRLPSAQAVPQDILDFATGPWTQLIVEAHHAGEGAAAGAMGDPGGYLALVPSLLWSVSAHAWEDAQRLAVLAPRLQERLCAGLRAGGHSEQNVQSFSARLAALHQDALDASRDQPATVVDLWIEPAEPALDQALPETVSPSLDTQFAAIAPQLGLAEPHPVQSAQTVSAAVPLSPPATALAELRPEPPPLQAPSSVSALQALAQPAAVAEAGAAPVEQWPLGTWVELSNARQQVLTQLTWVSPQQTLFLFTAADGSTQSMTRRMRDKLLAQGQLRRLPLA